MRSVVVVLPASICAMIPMFRYWAMGVVRAMRGTFSTGFLARLPAVMGERLVGVGHFMGVFALLDGVAASIEGVEQLGGEFLGHAVARAVARGLDDPADGERLTALRANLDRNLVGGAADAAGADFDSGLHILQRLVEGGDRILLELGLDVVEGAVDDTLGDRLLATLHQRVHELREHDIAELGVRQDFTLFSCATTGHLLPPRLTSDAWRRTSNGVVYGP